jgi:ketosteroid isomerase-like protein
MFEFRSREHSTMRTGLLIAAFLTTALSAAPPQGTPSTARLAGEVRSAEQAFARTMAVRDHAAFTSHLAQEALFFGDQDVLRGRAAVAAGWKRFFDGPTAPFSWEPAQVEVLESGTLALSSGPVRDPQGRRIGTFNSIWRREPDGSWKVLFDKGCPPCDCTAKP